MNDDANVRHGYWKVWGHAAECSECGHVQENNGDKYCLRCGAMMDGEPRWKAPKLSLPQLIHWKCRYCDCERSTTEKREINFCPKCGKGVVDD